MERNSGLDGLRGAAVILVTLDHSNVPFFRFGGTVGVTLFFILSGYLITSLLIEEVANTGRVSFANFYARRAVRLLPALTLALIGGALIFGLCGATRTEIVEAVISNIFYVNNLHQLTGWSVGPFHYYWSLSLEEQYYLIWPFLWYGLLRFGWKSCFAATSIITLISLYFRFAGDITDAAVYKSAMFMPLGTAWALLIGSALGILLSRSYVRVPEWLFAFSVVGIIFIASAMGMKDGFYEKRDILQLYLRLSAGPLSAIFSTIVVAGIVTAPNLSKFFASPILVFFGMISYALYLWHGVIEYPLNIIIGSQGIPGLIAGLLAAAIAIVLATASWHLVEKPMLSLKKKYKPYNQHFTRENDLRCNSQVVEDLNTRSDPCVHTTVADDNDGKKVIEARG